MSPGFSVRVMPRVGSLLLYTSSDRRDTSQRGVVAGVSGKRMRVFWERSGDLTYAWLFHVQSGDGFVCVEVW